MDQENSQYLVLEQPKRFSESMLWDMQEEYYNSTGIDAWRKGEIPFYITSNPVMGKTYAEIVFAFLKDLARQDSITDKVYLLDLGAGHGRLCYLFLKHLEKLVDSSSQGLPHLCYILSDRTSDSHSFWESHPRLHPYFEKGWLDISRVDVRDTSEIHLKISGDSIKPNSLQNPLIVIANYFFDSIPNDLFYFEGREIQDVWLSLILDKKFRESSQTEIIENLKLTYGAKLLEKPPYEQKFLNDLLESYIGKISKTHLLFPHLALQCLNQLKKLAPKGLFLLTADKGYYRSEDLNYRQAPQLVTHGGCFSLTVNYHAIKEYCIKEGGIALLPKGLQFSICLGCFLFLPNPSTYAETTLAYSRFVEDFSPDDFFQIKSLIGNHLTELNYPQISGTIRLSNYDAILFQQLVPQIHELIPSITNAQRWDLFQTLIKVWEFYYPIGEDQNLAFDIGELFYALNYYEEAITFLELSSKIYGDTITTLYNLSLCYLQLELYEPAKKYILTLLNSEPENERANALLHDLNKASESVLA